MSSSFLSEAKGRSKKDDGTSPFRVGACDRAVLEDANEAPEFGSLFNDELVEFAMWQANPLRHKQAFRLSQGQDHRLKPDLLKRFAELSVRFMNHMGDAVVAAQTERETHEMLGLVSHPRLPEVRPPDQESLLGQNDRKRG